MQQQRVGLAVFVALLAASGSSGHRIRRAPPADYKPDSCLPQSDASVRSLSVYYNPGEGFYLRDGCVDGNATAYGFFRPSINATGWDELQVATRATGSDNRMTMFAAGLLEGLLTADRIDAHYANLIDSLLPRDSREREKLRLKLRSWLAQQADWAQNFSDTNPTDPLARNVGYLMAQLHGLINGYFIATTQQPSPDAFVLHLANAAADSGDIINLLRGSWPDWESMTSAEFSGYAARRGHCTALVRLLPGLEDLLMAHNTWNAYAATLRTFKHYNLRLANDSSFVGGRQSFGGYPGTLASLDAFYAIDNRLVLLQTTNEVFNASLFASVTPRSLLAWQRVRAANQLATSGAHWAEQFSKHNSGTYNNQYMIVDLRRFQPSASLDDGALTIVEQIPDLVRYSDQTAILRAGYWPSYNVPFHRDIYRISGYPEVVRKHGLDYSYQMAPRAKILRRDAATKVGNLAQLRALMRRNRYRSEPFAEGDACKCLCCRGDLLKPASARGAFGCYDAKAISGRQVLLADGAASSPAAAAAAVWAISGPTTDDGGLPAFSWAASGFGRNASHRQLPAVYNFGWVQMRSTLP